MSAPAVRLVPVTFDDPRATAMLAEFTADMGVRYPGSPPTPASAEQFTGPVGVFLVGLAGDEPVVCGGLRPHGPGEGELKKLFVSPAARGTGLGRALVRALVEHGRAAGLRRLVLQTGVEQPEAIALYADAGYRPVAGYGIYACSAGAVFLGKQLHGAPDGGGGASWAS